MSPRGKAQPATATKAGGPSSIHDVNTELDRLHRSRFRLELDERRRRMARLILDSDRARRDAIKWPGELCLWGHIRRATEDELQRIAAGERVPGFPGPGLL